MLFIHVAPGLRPKLLVYPIGIVQGTLWPSQQPPTNAVVMERVVALTPSSDTLLLGIRNQVGLALDTWFHEMVPTNGTVLHLDVPQPERHRRPLLHLKPLLRIRRLFIDLLYLLVAVNIILSCKVVTYRQHPFCPLQPSYRVQFEIS